MNKLAELSWKRQDYIDRGQEVPERLGNSPELCEGEAMSDGEIETYINDGIQTLKVLKQAQSAKFEPARDAFFADLQFLVTIDRLAAEDYSDIIAPDNYEF